MLRRDLLKAGLAAVWMHPRFTKDPFSLGIASGDPWADSVVLWTRLAPEPLAPVGGMPNEKVPVTWRIAADERMTKIIRQGVSFASPEWAHSVHVEVHGLEPDRWYWYQFDAGSGAARVLSPVGRTKTMPARDSRPDRFRLAFVSCQKYESGYFTAFEHMAEEDLSLAIHLGDYIYEKGPAQGVRKMPIETSFSLEQYRTRYAFYKMDPALQKVHARFPWAVVSDDHEVSNNYAGLIAEKESLAKGFEQRRAAAYRAYYEHMPLRAAVQPHDAYMTLYRTLHVGQLADLQMLDTRQYRTDQPCGDGVKPSCPAREGPSTMMGDAQEAWLCKQLAAGNPKWQVLAQQIIFASIDADPGAGHKYMMDKWDGYPQARQRLVDYVVERKMKNVVVLSGDNHNNWVLDVKRDPNVENSPVVASEFVGTSITSNGDGAEISPEYGALLTKNPQIKFHNSRRGYVRCDVTPKQWTTDFRVVPYVSRPGAPIETRATFVVENGRPGPVKA